MPILSSLLFTHAHAFCVDQHSGYMKASKVRSTNLPLEYYLERLVSNIENPLPSWNISIPACEWQGVSCKDKEVQALEWQKINIGGQLNFASFKFFPFLQNIDIAYTSISGSITLESFPESLELMTLARNSFSGHIELASLPSNLQKCKLFHNQLSGEIDLTRLPCTVEVLSLHENMFSGPVDLTKLSPKMRHLVLSDNKFEGSIDATSFPESLEHFWIEKNRLSGIVDLRLVSQKLVFFNLSGNYFKEFIGPGPPCATLYPQNPEL